MLSCVATFALAGIDSNEVTVEVDLRPGLPAFAVVGLADTAVREARERVRGALQNSDLGFPMKRITVNLAPASMRKGGPSFDLAIATGVLAADGKVPVEGLRSYAICGELSLTGTVRPIRGALAVALGAHEAGYERLIVPQENAAEAALVDGIEVLGVRDLGELVRLLRGEWRPEPPDRGAPRPPSPTGDMVDVRGQADAKRALEIAAAGGHNILMVGPPGAGKTMLARRVRSILPPPDFEEAVEITRIHSVAGLSDGRLASERPFRAPHHTISASGLVGGGSTPRAGEITLAHRGVLFLDELAEFGRPSLEALRQPLETRRVEVMRGNRWATLPAAAMVIAACNRCPCGRADCQCREIELSRYANRLSAPLLDRLDLVCEVSVPSAAELDSGAHAEPSAAIRERVVAAREQQRARLARERVVSNAEMSGPQTRRHVPLVGTARARLASGRGDAGFSARGHDRVLRVARTIADLDGRDLVGPDDIDEALAYRIDDPLAVAA